MPYWLKEMTARIKEGESDDDIAAVMVCKVQLVQLVRDVLAHPEVLKFDSQGRVCLVDPRNG
jgi:hypothetical protein